MLNTIGTGPAALARSPYVHISSVLSSRTPLPLSSNQRRNRKSQSGDGGQSHFDHLDRRR
jgi:hypothetical protein